MCECKACLSRLQSKKAMSSLKSEFKHKQKKLKTLDFCFDSLKIIVALSLIASILCVLFYKEADRKLPMFISFYLLAIVVFQYLIRYFLKIKLIKVAAKYSYIKADRLNEKLLLDVKRGFINKAEIFDLKFSEIFNDTTKQEGDEFYKSRINKLIETFVKDNGYNPWASEAAILTLLNDSPISLEIIEELTDYVCCRDIIDNQERILFYAKSRSKINAALIALDLKDQGINLKEKGKELINEASKI